MWGNSLGWSLAALIALTCGGAVWFVATSSAPTPPTAFSKDESHFAPIALPPPPTDAATSGSPPIAADQFYFKAIELYQSDRPLYEDFARLGKLDPETVAKLTAIDPIVQAAPATNVHPFTSAPKRIVNYANAKPDLDALQLLGGICVDRLGLLNARAGKTDEALKYERAAFALGQNLANERLAYDEFEVGMELMAKASASMASFREKTGKTDLAAQWHAFDAARIDLMKRQIDPVLHVVRSIDAKVVGTNTGDVFELAKRSRERMLRVEAILALGRVRYFAGNGGTAANQRNALRLVRDLADNDPDSIIRTAAAAARDLTIEQHRAQ